MANPIISIAANKSSYAIGELMTVTATYSDPDAKTIVIHGTAMDAEGNVTPATVNVSLADPVTVVITDDGNRTWTKISDSGSVAVFTATA